MNDLAPWPPELDALIAAPEHHRLVLENDQVRVLDTRIKPGDKTPVHTHMWPAVHHVLSWSPFVRRNADDVVMLDTRAVAMTADVGAVLWSEAFPPHSLENVGEHLLHVLSIEIKTKA